MQEIVNFLVDTVHDWGYFGIFALMFLESSFFPFPSEVVMIPAGYLVYQDKMSLIGVFLAGTGGSLAGAVFNYYLCYFFGRSLIEKYGRYFGITEEKMKKFEIFFTKHGEISTFNCRLIPGIRQYISLPAGLAKMNLAKFCLFTTLGAGIWMVILIAIGYFIGGNQELIKEQLKLITILLLIVVVMIFVFYFIFTKKKANK